MSVMNAILVVLRQHWLAALAAIAAIMAGHWFRYGYLEGSDFLSALIAFVIVIGVAAWLDANKKRK